MKYLKEFIASAVMLFTGAGSIIIGWQWVETQFQKKTEAELKYTEQHKRSTELYLEIKMDSTEEYLKDYERRVDAQEFPKVWEQRRYSQKKAAMMELIEKDNELKGL